MPTPRLLQPADIPAYRALRLESLTDAPWASGATPGDDPVETPGYLDSIIEAPDQHIIILDHPDCPGQLAAAAGLRRYPSKKTNHRAMIWGVYTTPAMRRQGLARQVMQHTIDTAKEWDGLRYIALTVAATSAGPIALYESLGFTQWGTEPGVICIDGTDHDETSMVLKL